MVQSIVAEIGNEKHMTQMRARPASMTSDSDVRQQVALEHAARFARAVVLPDKARAGDVKRVHHGVDEVIHIARRGVALDDDGAERIDARLNEEVCDREDRVLQTCRHADRQRVDGLVLVEADLF